MAKIVSIEERMRQAVLLYDPSFVKFTIEPARGETYDSGELTLYFHNIWQDGVLKGQPCRSYYGPVSESFWKNLPEDLRALTTYCGSTHIPMEERVKHISHD